MIVCADCLHHNPDGSTYCEACGVKLPKTSSCSNCGALVEATAHFCSQCGFNLQLTQRPLAPQPLAQPQRVNEKSTRGERLLPEPPPPEPILTLSEESVATTPEIVPDSPSEKVNATRPSGLNDLEDSDISNTQIQSQSAKLLHVQSNTLIDLNNYGVVAYLGKPNGRVPPDINVGNFPHSEVVSRVHAAIHLEIDQYFVEDVGSANGTYVNRLPLTVGTKHPLRKGDRISLGKGDLVTFIFQLY